MQAETQSNIQLLYICYCLCDLSKNSQEKAHRSNIPDKLKDRLCIHFVLLTPSVISSHLFQMLRLHWHNYTTTYLSCGCDWLCWVMAAPGICIIKKITHENLLQKLIGPEGFSVIFYCMYMWSTYTKTGKLAAFNQFQWNHPKLLVFFDMIVIVR